MESGSEELGFRGTDGSSLVPMAGNNVDGYFDSVGIVLGRVLAKDSPCVQVDCSLHCRAREENREAVAAVCRCDG